MNLRWAATARSPVAANSESAAGLFRSVRRVARASWSPLSTRSRNRWTCWHPGNISGLGPAGFCWFFTTSSPFSAVMLMVAGRHQGGAGQQLDEFTAMSHLGIEVVEFLPSGPPTSGFGLPVGAFLGVAGGRRLGERAATQVFV